MVNGPNHPGAIGPAPARITPIVPTIPASVGKPKGWRDIYVEKGPEAWAEAVRKHKGVLVTDTTM